MARIAGATIPTDKRVVIALTYIYGIGSTTSEKILENAGIDPNTRVKDLSESEIASLRDQVAQYQTEGDLKRIVTTNIKRLKDINAYRGLRHKKNLPVKGQRTRTNARTKRGRKQTVGGTTMKSPTKT